MSSVRRQFWNDSRSPTVEQALSCNVPVRSRENHGNNTLMQLLHGFRAQIQEGRKVQAKFMVDLEAMLTDMNEIRERQNSYWDEIMKAMRRANLDMDKELDEELDDFHDSQTQAWPVGRPYRNFQADSDAGDSVIGPVSDGNFILPAQPELRTGRIGGSTTTRPGQPDRGSTELDMDDLIGVRDAILLEADGYGPSTMQEATQIGTASDSRLPTPITPGTQQRKPRGRPPTSNPKERRGPTSKSNIASNSKQPKSGAMKPPAAPASSSKQSKPTSMRAPPTPTSKGKRKRVEEVVEMPISANRPVRQAGQATIKRNAELLEWAQRSAREQSKARNAGAIDPFVVCGGCRKPGCKRCEERLNQEVYSTTMRIQ